MILQHGGGKIIAGDVLIKTGYHGKIEPKSIADITVSAEDFDTLVMAIKATGLVDIFKSRGPYTVFAPTDEAIVKFPETDSNALLKDKKALLQIVTNYVVPGKIKSTDVVKLKSATVVEGKFISLSTDSRIKANKSPLIKADVMTSNGLMHIIDTMLMPKR